MLYPFKFTPQLFHKIWGGHTIEKWYNHVPADYENVGESWVMSDVEKYPTEVCNGSHAGDTLQDLLEVYLDELVGGKVYEQFGTHFPLLLKFIDATDDLSIQVHPDDEYALDNVAFGTGSGCLSGLESGDECLADPCGYCRWDAG